MIKKSVAARLAAAMVGGEVDEDDVYGIALKLPGGWPFYFVELRLGGMDELKVVGGELIGLDMLATTLETLELRPTRDLMQPPEPPHGPTRFVVQRKPAPRRPSGIFGPDVNGTPRGWSVIAPLPPWPPEFDVIVPTCGWQIGVYLTTRTTYIYGLQGEALLAALQREGDAGRLYATRAAVV